MQQGIGTDRTHNSVRIFIHYRVSQKTEEIGGFQRIFEIFVVFLSKLLQKSLQITPNSKKIRDFTIFFAKGIDKSQKNVYIYTVYF